MPAMRGDALISIINLDEETRNSYEALTEKLEERYPPLYTPQQYHEQFRVAEQGGKSISEWTNTLRQLADRAGEAITELIGASHIRQEEYIKMRTLEGMRPSMKLTLEARHTTEELEEYSINKITTLCQEIEARSMAAMAGENRPRDNRWITEMQANRGYSNPEVYWTSTVYRHPNYKASKQTGRKIAYSSYGAFEEQRLRNRKNERARRHQERLRHLAHDRQKKLGESSLGARQAQPPDRGHSAQERMNDDKLMVEFDYRHCEFDYTPLPGRTCHPRILDQ
jgi:hypothetical protein